VIVEEGTHNVSLINCFTRRTAVKFPSDPQGFVIYSALANGVGTISIGLVVMRLDSSGTVYERTVRVTFPDILQEVRFSYRVSNCSFPAAGTYEILLTADGDMIAQTRFSVALRRNTHE
jgi:hypothetical protein